MASKVTEKNNKELQSWLKDLLESNTQVKVGILTDPASSNWNAGSRKLVRGKTSVRMSRTPLIGVALVHEFGMGNVPQRSFLRSTWDENREKIQKVYKTLIKREMQNSPRARESILRVQEQMGNWLSSKVKRKFTNNDWPPLKRMRPVMARKLARMRKRLETSMKDLSLNTLEKPLIDTGQLRASISYSVEVKS